MTDISDILARPQFTPAQRKYRWKAILASGGGGKVTPAIRMSGYSLLENSPVDTFIGTLSVIGAIGTPSFTLVDSSTNKAKLTGNNILAGTSTVNYETTTSFNIIVSVTGVVPAIANTTITINVGDVDEVAPTITSSNAITLVENIPLSHTLTANEPVTWTKTGGADTALFTVAGSTLSMTAKNFEAPADADVNNVYVVQVTATDLAGNATNQTVSVTVTDADEIAPTITSSASVSQAENAILNHSLTANETVTWTKTGGLDASLFTLAGSTLTLAAKDYEIPTDSNADGVYVVQVTATDLAGNATNQTISVTITDVAEGGALSAPTLNLQAASDTGTSSTDNITSLTSLGFDVTAPDALVTDSVTWRLYKNGSLVGTTTVTGNTVTFAGVTATAGTDNWTATYQVGANLSAVSANETVTVDTTAPTLSSPTGTKTGTTTATITVDVAETGGDLFWVADQNLTTPSGAQVIAGQDQGGAAADKSGSSLAIASTGTKTFNLTGLTSSTTYKGYFAYRDVAGNISTVAASASFTTDSAVVTMSYANADGESGNRSGLTSFSSGSMTFSAGACAVCLLTATSATDVVSVVIKGVTATRHDHGGSGGFFSATGITAGTGTIDVTFAAAASTYVTIAKLDLIGGSGAFSLFNHFDASTTNPANGWIPTNIPANGVGVAIYGGFTNTTITPGNWSGCDGVSSLTNQGTNFQTCISINAKTNSGGSPISFTPSLASPQGSYMVLYTLTWGP